MIVIGVTVVVSACLGAGAGGERVTVIVTDVGSFLAATVASAACAGAAWRASSQRRPWILLAIATGLWALGELTWSIYEVVLDQPVPFPSIADVAYLAGVPVAVVGLLGFAGVTAPGHRLRVLLDACMVAASLLFITWVLVLGSAWHGSAADAVLSRTITVAYPVTDVVLAAVALFIVQWGRSTDRRALTVLAVAMTVMASVDVAYTWLDTHGGYLSTDPISAGWLAAYLLIALAAQVSSSPAVGPDSGSTSESSVAFVLPYLPLALAAAFAAARVIGGGPLGPFLIVNLAGLVALVLVRQAVLTFELRSTLGALHVPRSRAGSPCAARQPDRAGQPLKLRSTHGDGDGRRAPPARDRVHRPRRVQAGQRPLRPRGR